MKFSQNPSLLQNAFYNLEKMKNYVSSEDLKSLVLFLNSFICPNKLTIFYCVPCTFKFHSLRTHEVC